MTSPDPSRPGAHPTLLYGVVLAAILAVLLVFAMEPSLEALAANIASHGAFLWLGTLGAIFANSTGAGGGVVFIPTFNQMGFSEAQAVATSFGIQSFGMTAGAITWSLYFHRQQRPMQQWRTFPAIVAICSVCSLLGLWCVYGLDIGAPAAITPMFALFSLCLGVAILVTMARRVEPRGDELLPLADVIALALIAGFGGFITAWLSVGVGEFVAFYLILRRYDVTLSVAAAVVISAITVWGAAPEHLLQSNANWQVIAFAGPGAIIGALIARPLVLKLGARRLKLFFGSWLVIIGLVEFSPLLPGL